MPQHISARARRGGGFDPCNTTSCGERYASVMPRPTPRDHLPRCPDERRTSLRNAAVLMLPSASRSPGCSRRGHRGRPRLLDHRCRTDGPIAVAVEGTIVERFPPVELQRVLLFGNVQVTTQAVALLLQH